MCPFDWYLGGQPKGGGMCKNAEAEWSCVDAVPPLVADGGVTSSDQCLSYGGQFICQCRSF
jgi:hypothetical protein